MLQSTIRRAWCSGSIVHLPEPACSSNRSLLCHPAAMRTGSLASWFLAPLLIAPWAAYKTACIRGISRPATGLSAARAAQAQRTAPPGRPDPEWRLQHGRCIAVQDTTAGRVVSTATSRAARVAAAEAPHTTTAGLAELVMAHG